jgi:hypothetical protein
VYHQFAFATQEGTPRPNHSTLAHLQMVVSTKLRRGEPFFLTWVLPAYMGSGRHSIWIDNAVPLFFLYASTSRSTLDMTWMDRALIAAASPKGLYLPEGDPFSSEAPKTPVP